MPPFPEHSASFTSGKPKGLLQRTAGKVPEAQTEPKAAPCALSGSGTAKAVTDPERMRGGIVFGLDGMAERGRFMDFEDKTRNTKEGKTNEAGTAKKRERKAEYCDAGPQADSFPGGRN